MATSFFTLSPRHALALIVAGGFGLVVSACNGASQFLAQPAGHDARGMTPQTGSTSTPIPFRYQTIDDPDSGVNAVTGINQLKKITGVFGGGSASNIPESYTSRPPFTKFRLANDPGAQGTYATGLSSNYLIVGYVIAPGSLKGTWGFIRAHDLWTLLSDSKEGSGKNAVTEILGVNDSEFGVGFYTNNSGTKIPFEVDIANETFTDLKPPGAKLAEATGINGKSNVSGWEYTSKGTISFYLQTGTYYTLSYPGAKATYAMGLNWQDQIVGYFLDSHRKAHGFLLTGPTRGGKEQVWQIINEPKAAKGTWVTGINNHDDIVGYYVDASGVQHGFLAEP